MIRQSETEAGSAGMQPCRGITWWAHRDDEGRGNSSRALPKLDRIERPRCLENPRPKGRNSPPEGRKTWLMLPRFVRPNGKSLGRDRGNGTKNSTGGGTKTAATPSGHNATYPPDAATEKSRSPESLWLRRESPKRFPSARANRDSGRAAACIRATAATAGGSFSLRTGGALGLIGCGVITGSGSDHGMIRAVGHNPD